MKLVPLWDPHWTMSLCHFENICLENCIACRRYVDDTLQLFVQQNMYKNLQSILTSNTKTLPTYLKLNKMVHCHFSPVEI